jgi:hypothetical protein
MIDQGELMNRFSVEHLAGSSRTNIFQAQLSVVPEKGEHATD